MKITITMSKAEIAVIKNLVVKYAPINSKTDDMFADKHIESKVGVFDSKDSCSVISADFKEEMVIDAMKFGDEISEYIKSMIIVVKPFFANFKKSYKKFFDKWNTSLEETVVNNLVKKAAGKFVVAAVVSYDTWVETKKDVKKKKHVASIYEVRKNPLDIDEITADLENAKVTYVIIYKNGKVTMSTDKDEFDLWAKMKIASNEEDETIDWVSMADHEYNELYNAGQRIGIYMLTKGGSRKIVMEKSDIDFFSDGLNENDYRFMMIDNESYELGGIDDAKKFFKDHKACW